MKKNFIYFCTLIVLLSGCANEEITQSESMDNIICNPELGFTLIKEGDVLVFDSEEAFNFAVEQFNSAELRLKEKNGLFFREYISLKSYGFTSLFDDFESAMDEAVAYNEKEGGYEEFKNKYSTLYFPEYGDDYSAYLPVSNRNVAKLLNQKGEVSIGGKIVDYRDINSYAQLVELGLTWENETAIEKITTRGEDVENTESINEFPKGGQGSTWYHGTSRKKLKIRCYKKGHYKYHPVNTNLISEEYIMIDVAFRSKNMFGGWYNHNGRTTMGYMNGQLSVTSGTMKDNSSHDYPVGDIWINKNTKEQIGIYDYKHWVLYAEFGFKVFFTVRF